jgi:glycosyltransferase involved in cell wall biosynthesis
VRVCTCGSSRLKRLLVNIGIDVTALSTSASGGIGTAVHSVLTEFVAMDTGHRFTLYGTRPPLVPFSDEVFDPGWPLRLGTGPLARSNILWLRSGVASMLAEDHIDVFWGARQVVPSKPGRCATVVTVHDFWDRFYPGQQPLVNRMLNRWVVDTSVRDADVITPISHATAEDLRRLYGVAGERVAVVRLGVDAGVFSRRSQADVATTAQRFGLDGPYVLAMDVFNPRKNAAAVLDAFAALPEAVRTSHRLVLLGRPRRTARALDVEGIAARLGIADRVVLLGDLPFADLLALYSGAAALVFPSVYEGFGMPVLEAMACGCPVVTSNTSSLPEVAGDAALLVDPRDAAAVASALQRVLTDDALSASLGAKGVERAAAFTWRRTAEGMLSAFERAVELRAAREERR